MNTIVLMLAAAAVTATATATASAAVALSDGSHRWQQAGRSNDLKRQDLWDVLTASKRILDYYNAYMTDMNFDAVLGTTMAEARYAVLMDILDSGNMAPYDREAMEFLRQLLGDIKRFNAKATNNIRKVYPADFIRSFGRILEHGFFEIPLSYLHLDNSSISYKEFDGKRVLQGVEQLNEDKSDACINEILSGEQSNVTTHSNQQYKQFKRCIQSDNQHLSPENYPANEIAHHFLRKRHMNKDIRTSKCLISEWCWSSMSKEGYSGYSLTHQLFYLVIAMQAGCMNQINDAIACVGGKPLEDMIRGLCNNILMEAQTIANAGYPEMRQDLFMEQGAFCGQLGYDNFFPRSWLRQVLSWQRDIGCYGDFQLYSSLKKQDNAQKRTNHIEKAKTGYIRTKRAEKSMPGQCMAHRTATAIGYLAVALRTLIFH